MIKKYLLSPTILLIKKVPTLTYQLSIFFMISAGAYAQGPGMPGGPDYDPDKEVPIDGGIGVLLAAGLAYGIKKIRETNQLKEENREGR